ncbi:hypothetical protein BV25DRAFT_1787864, partial [Artomyces pyxidatus]
MIQIVNTLTVKLEIGGPMASLYVLQHPDHYTSHTFKTFFWKPYVNEVSRAFGDLEETDLGYDSVVIGKVQSNVVALSPVTDYVERPVEYKDMSLYDWIRCATK